MNSVRLRDWQYFNLKQEIRLVFILLLIENNNEKVFYSEIVTLFHAA